MKYDVKATKPKDLETGMLVVLDEQVWEIEGIEAGNVYNLDLRMADGTAKRVFNLGCRASIGVSTKTGKELAADLRKEATKDAAPTEDAPTPEPEAPAAKEPAPKPKATKKPLKGQAARDRLEALTDEKKVLIHLDALENDVIPKVEGSKRFELQDPFVGPFSPEVARIKDTKESTVFMFYSFKKDLRMVSVPRNGHPAMRKLMGDIWCAQHFILPKEAYQERITIRQEIARAKADEKKAAKVKARKEEQGK